MTVDVFCDFDGVINVFPDDKMLRRGNSTYMISNSSRMISRIIMQMTQMMAVSSARRSNLSHAQPFCL